MERNDVRKKSTDVTQLQLVGQEFREFEHARQQMSQVAAYRRVTSRHFWEMLANHGNARSRGDTNSFRVTKYFKKVEHHGTRVGLVAAVVVHLSAASLGGAKLHGVTKAFEERDDGFAGLRKKSVVIAGNKKRYEHRLAAKETVTAGCGTFKRNARTV
ncbi:MAG: hypothetical protein NVS9B4_15000 [Candidatus Acidiferrum sp.]